MTSSFVFLPDRAVLALSGPDTRTFLQGLVTQNVDTVRGDRAAYACLLTPQGKITADFVLLEHNDAVLLECDSSVAGAILKKLQLYKLRADLNIVDVSNDWQVAASWDSEEIALPDGTRSFQDPRLIELGHRHLLPRSAQVESTDAAAYERHRLRLGVPQFGKDFSADQAFAMDVNIDELGGMDYKKGCFVGQEVASRMKRKGTVRKRTWLAFVEYSAPGVTVLSGDSTIGEITSGLDQTCLVRVRLDRLAQASEPLLTSDGKPVRLEEPAYLKGK